MQQIEPAELRDRLARDRPQLLDVREPWELALCALADSIHIPMREIPVRYTELDASRPVVCICHHGARSMQVGMFLEQRGFDRVFNLAGGIDAWAREVDPSLGRY